MVARDKFADFVALTVALCNSGLSTVTVVFSKLALDDVGVSSSSSDVVVMISGTGTGCLVLVREISGDDIDDSVSDSVEENFLGCFWSV